MRYTLTLRQNHFESLNEHLIQPDGKERVAFLLCGRAYIESDPWEELPEERFLSREVHILPNTENIESTIDHVTWKTDFLIKLLKRAEKEDLGIILVHNHPDEIDYFSSIDNQYEPELFRLVFNRNGGTRPHASLIITPDKKVFGRVFNSQLELTPIEFIRILGDQFTFLYKDRSANVDAELFHRQILLFGQSLNQDLFNLRVGIIGCGGTGSAAATLLARLGVGRMLLVDKDFVETSNLNRLHGASKSDALAKNQKTDVLASYIKSLELGTEVKKLNRWADSDGIENHLKSCDIVFGCTDDHHGRSLLNRLAYFYLIPLIDMGLIIHPTKTNPPAIIALDGRYTVLFPQKPCLLCREIIDIQKAAEEDLKRSDPYEYESRKKEAYVIGEENPSPAVVTFTTEVATMAINEFIHRIQGFRGPNGFAWERRRLFLTCEDRRTGGNIREGCEVCGLNKYWGRGDMVPFLNRV